MGSPTGLKRQPARLVRLPVTVPSVDRSDNPVGRDSHSGSRYSLDSLGRADRGSRPDSGSRRVLCQDNRDGTDPETLALRDSRASNAPLAADGSDAPGLPAVEHRRGSTHYSECEPCHSRFARNLSVRRAPPPTARLVQRCKRALRMLDVETFLSPPWRINSASSIAFRFAGPFAPMRQRRPPARNRHQRFRLALAGGEKMQCVMRIPVNSNADATSSKTTSARSSAASSTARLPC